MVLTLHPCADPLLASRLFFRVASTPQRSAASGLAHCRSSSAIEAGPPSYCGCADDRCGTARGVPSDRFRDRFQNDMTAFATSIQSSSIQALPQQIAAGIAAFALVLVLSPLFLLKGARAQIHTGRKRARRRRTHAHALTLSWTCRTNKHAAKPCWQR